MPREPKRLSDRAPARSTRGRVVTLIITYKLVKATAWLVLALVIVVMMRMGLGYRLWGLADHLRHHARAWSIALANLVTKVSTNRGLWTVVVALLSDAVVSLVEAWSLIHGRWWGPWVVVVATGSLLPFEVVAFVHHPHAVRAAIFAVNAAIVAYLARKAIRERGETADRAPASGQRVA